MLGYFSTCWQKLVGKDLRSDRTLKFLGLELMKPVIIPNLDPNWQLFFLLKKNLC